MQVLNALHLINYLQRDVSGHKEKGIGPIGMTSSALKKEMRTIVNSSSKQSS